MNFPWVCKWFALCMLLICNTSYAMKDTDAPCSLVAVEISLLPMGELYFKRREPQDASERLQSRNLFDTDSLFRICITRKCSTDTCDKCHGFPMVTRSLITLEQYKRYVSGLHL